MIKLEVLLSRLAQRVRPFFDLTAWVLFGVSLVPLYLINRPMLFTLIQWTAFALALAGASVGLSRLLLPQVDLAYCVRRAGDGEIAPALVVLAVALLLGMLFLGIVLWAKG